MKLSQHFIAKSCLILALAGASVIAQGSSKICEKPQVGGYDDVSCLYGGLSKVEQNNKFGFIDKTGQVAVSLKYDDARHFGDGLAAVKQHGKWGFVDKTGQVVIPLQYDFVDSFNEGLAVVKKDGEWLTINKQGQQASDLALQ